MTRKLTNQAAFLMARQLLAIVENCLRPEEHRDVLVEFFEVCRRGLNAHEMRTNTTHVGLNPSNN
jgi:hypothetical protein